MNFFYRKSNTLWRASEIEFKPAHQEKEFSKSDDFLIDFFNELERLIRAHHDYITFHEMYDLLYLLDCRNDSKSNREKFFNVLLVLKSIMLDLYKEDSVYSHVFLAIFITGLIILTQQKSLLHDFFAKIADSGNADFLKKPVPVNTKIFSPYIPKLNIEDILLRNARESHLTESYHYLLSNGISEKSGTVLQEIITQLPKKSALKSYLLSGNVVITEIMGLFLFELRQTLNTYKARLFCMKSSNSDRAASVLENNLFDNRPSFSKIIINISRFMSEKTLTKKPGELFKRLFGLWQAGLWILSRHRDERENFFRISDNSHNSALQCRMWTEYYWEKKGYLKTTIGDYLMRIAIETEDLTLQLMLTQRMASLAKSSLLEKIQASLSSESLLRVYYQGKAQLVTPKVYDEYHLCSVTAFSDACDSLDLSRNSSVSSFESATLAI